MAHRLLILISALSLFAGEQLNQRDAKRLVENTPDFINAAKADRCPQAELLWSGCKDFGFQVRSRCTKSPSGLIGNFVVDRETAEVWIGVDRNQLVESNHLRRLQDGIRKQRK